MSVDVVVNLEASAGNADQLARLLVEGRDVSRQAEGCESFELFRRQDDPNRFTLYEVYRAQSGFEDHQKTPHYLRWRETVKDWMAVPRVGVRHKSLFPEAEGDW